MRNTKFLKRWWIPVLALVVALSCSTPGDKPAEPTSDVGFQETKFALGVQETSVAMQQTSQAIVVLQQTMQAGTETANQAIAQTNTAAAVPPPTQTSEPTQTPEPSQTPQPTQEILPASTQGLPPPPPTAEVVDMSESIKGANVLVYEDMAGSADRYRLVIKAVNNMGFSGGRVVDVADRAGDFKNELTGTTDWDLIIAAVEGRSVVQGEFWGYIQRHIQNNAAVIIENWNLDQHYTDISPLFGDCGITFEKDWVRLEDYNFLDYSIVWLQPDHEFFQVVPNKNVSLGNPNFLYWVPPRTTDAGDKIRISSGGDATMLAGTNFYEKSRGGVLATCMGGRLIVQTYSTHDYKESEVVNLWEDYIVWTLTNHFKAIE